MISLTSKSITDGNSSCCILRCIYIFVQRYFSTLMTKHGRDTKAPSWKTRLLWWTTLPWRLLNNLAEHHRAKAQSKALPLNFLPSLSLSQGQSYIAVCSSTTCPLALLICLHHHFPNKSFECIFLYWNLFLRRPELTHALWEFISCHLTHTNAYLDQINEQKE